MSSIRIVDTSVFCNILRVPKMNQSWERVRDELEQAIEDDDALLLPMVTIYETGNHIAQNGDGRQRRNAAERFVAQVRLAIEGNSPFSPTPVPQSLEILAWLDEFPDYAKQKIGLGDLSIIHVYEQQRKLHRMRRVLIWSYDKHLQGYDSHSRR
jgi:hypothetical protein